MLGYLDAGSGSIIASAAAAGFAGGAVAIKMGWRRMTGKLKRGSSDEPEAIEAEAIEAEDAPEAETAPAEDTTAG